MRKILITLLSLGLLVAGAPTASADVPPEKKHCVWTQPTGWHCVALFPEEPS